MLDILLYFIVFSIFILALMFSHQLGHYIMARMAGIPKDCLRIKKFFPPQLQIKDEKRHWVSVEQKEDYIKAYNSYRPDSAFTYYYLGGGMLAETDLVILGSLVIYFLPVANIYLFSFVFLSLLLNFIYIVKDMILTFINREPYSDFSNMWMISRWRTVVIFALLFGVRFLILWLYFFYI